MVEGQDQQRPADLVPRLANFIHSDAVSNGDRAVLKRMHLRGPAPLAYFRLLMGQVPEYFQSERLSPSWRSLIGGIALQHHAPHDPSEPLGRTLAAIGYSEKRLETLLAAEGDVARTLITRLARRLASARARCDWRDIALLLFARNSAERDRINERVARDFYRTMTKLAKES